MAKSYSIKRTIWIILGSLGTLIMLDGVTVPLRSDVMTSIPVHHLLHTGMAVGAGLLALALTWNRPTSTEENGGWVWPATLAPALSLFLMWPTKYAYLMTHPWLHVLDHLGIAACSVLAIYAAERFTRGLAWPMLALVVAMNAGAAGGFGLTYGPAQPIRDGAITGQMTVPPSISVVGRLAESSAEYCAPGQQPLPPGLTSKK
ncbi:MAG: hypothetical protein KAX37_04765 [Opitutaceae bacterium]|nr:hypothetical protein [Opitutaceae bacterium]